MREAEKAFVEKLCQSQEEFEGGVCVALLCGAEIRAASTTSAPAGAPQGRSTPVDLKVWSHSLVYWPTAAT